VKTAGIWNRDSKPASHKYDAEVKKEPLGSVKLSGRRRELCCMFTNTATQHLPDVAQHNHTRTWHPPAYQMFLSCLAAGYRVITLPFCFSSAEEQGQLSRYSDWLRAGRPTGPSPIPERGKIFLLSTSSRPALRPTQPPIEWVPGVLSLGAKRSGSEADRSPPTSAEVKNT
jgi:hypothetical protein